MIPLGFHPTLLIVPRKVGNSLLVRLFRISRLSWFDVQSFVTAVLSYEQFPGCIVFLVRAEHLFCYQGILIPKKS